MAGTGAPAGALARLQRDAVALAAGQGLSQVLSASAVVLLARTSRSSELGVFAASFGVATALSVLVEFGLSDRMTTVLAARTPDGAVDFRSRFRGISTVTGLLVAVSAVVLVLSGGRVWSLVPALAGCLALERVALAPLRAHLRLVRVGMLLVLDRSVSLLALVVVTLVDRGSGHGTVFMAFNVMAALAVTALSRALWELGAEGSPGGRLRAVLDLYRRSRGFGRVQVAIGIQSFDTLILSVAGGAVAAAAYGAVYRWTSPMVLISQGVSQASLPRMSSAVLPAELAQLFKRTLLLTVAGTAPIVVGIWVAAPWLVELILGARYGSSAPVLRVLATSAFIASVNIPLLAFLQARGASVFAAWVFTIGVPLQLALLGVLATRVSLADAVVAIPLLQLLMGSCLAFGARRVWRASQAGADGTPPRLPPQLLQPAAGRP